MVRADLSYLRVESGHHLEQKARAFSAGTPTQQLSHVLARQRPVAHPISSLPPELLSLVFLHCLPSCQQLSLSTAPLLLTRICGGWRLIALRTPELWSTVFLELFALPVDRFEPKLRMLEYWLARSAAHSLSLYFHVRQPIPDAVPLLTAHAPRWRDVDLFLHRKTLAGFSSPDQQLPLLRRLSLACLPASEDDPHPEHWVTAFGDAPALVEVSLRRLAPKHVVLPWAQLTTFSVQCNDPGDALRVLLLAPGLETFSLDLTRSAEPTSALAELEPLVHDALRSLTLAVHPAAAPALPTHALLAPLTLPALRTLALPPLGPADVTPLHAFFARSASARTLTHLSAPLAPLAPHALVPLFAPLRALEDLALQYPTADAVLDLLAALHAAAEPAFLPCLHTLVLECARGGVPYAALLAGLQARSAAAPRRVVALRAFELSVMAPTPHEAGADAAYLLPLQTLKAQGMKLLVSHVYQASVV
ncbi:hypothetical protein B0H15DRAFT_581278 [Mycena belliarum]|uniref:F-box domain-containing protein n=1 Tax=Mycena belliarum TaxID=1033014 RepID=A0AAD6UCK4_9AGAR|nr:hypothetical protein B0H15DRAFT_581278 [Mycena belliae]